MSFDDFDIDPSLPFKKQKWSYKEDIIQISFDKPITVDVGWYPSFKPEGSFMILVVRDYDWDDPVYEKRCKSLTEMKQYLQEALDIADKMYREVKARKTSPVKQASKITGLSA